MIEAKAQGDYADRKGTVQNGEKKQFVGLLTIEELSFYGNQSNKM